MGKCVIGDGKRSVDVKWGAATLLLAKNGMHACYFRTVQEICMEDWRNYNG